MKEFTKICFMQLKLLNATKYNVKLGATVPF